MGYRKDSDADKPWHGLGTPIDHDLSPDEMLVQSGLNWTVSKRPLFTYQGAVLKVDDFNYPSLEVHDYFALVRDSDNKVLGPAGKEYIPTQNKQAMDFFKKFTDSGKMRLETAGSLQGGRQIWVLAKLLSGFTLVGGDLVQGYLLFSSPHVWGKSLIIKFTPIRVVCWNTFSIAMGDSSMGRGFRAPHIRAFDAEVVREAEISLSIAGELLNTFEASANLMSTTKIDDQAAIRYIADIMQPEMMVEQFGKGFNKLSEARQAELIVSPNSPNFDPSQFKRSAYDCNRCFRQQPGVDMESSKGTLWGSWNAVTYYCDHVAGRDRDNALTSAWFGPKSVLKTKAMRRAMQIVEVLR